MKENNDLYEVEIHLAKLHDEIGEYKLRRCVLQEDLTLINKRLKTPQPKSKYESLERRRASFTNDIFLLDTSAAKIKSEIRNWQALSLDLKVKSLLSVQVDVSKDKNLIENLKTLRSHYLSFAEDQTRINSMRVMAAQFANELTTLLSEN